MENVKFALKFSFVAFSWGVSITSLKTHLYEVTHNKCKGKPRVFGKKEEATLLDYIKKMQRIWHPIILT
jgi:hypothetical protein